MPSPPTTLVPPVAGPSRLPDDSVRATTTQPPQPDGPATDETARQLRRTSYRKPFKVNWSKSVWSTLGQEQLSSQPVGWAGLICPIAEPGAQDIPLPPPESDTHSNHDNYGYFFIDNQSMPQASNYPWGKTPLPSTSKRIKVSRSPATLAKPYRDINAALAADEEYDNRTVKRAILRGLGATEEDLEREDRASTVGPQSGHVNPNDDMDAISRRSVSAMGGTPRSHSRQLSMPVSLHEDADYEGYPTIDPRIRSGRASLSPDGSEQSHLTASASQVTSRSVSASVSEGRVPSDDGTMDQHPNDDNTTRQQSPQDVKMEAHPEEGQELPTDAEAEAEDAKPAVCAESIPSTSAMSSAVPSRSESPDFVIEMVQRPASSLEAQHEIIDPVPPPSSAPTRPTRRIPTTRGSRLSAAAVKRLKQRPKRERNEAESPDHDDDDDEDRPRHRRIRRSSAASSSAMDTQPQKFDLSEWGRPSSLRNMSQKTGKGVAVEADDHSDDEPATVNGEDDTAEADTSPRRSKGKGKQKETSRSQCSAIASSSAPAVRRMVLPPVDDSDGDSGGSVAGGSINAIRRGVQSASLGKRKATDNGGDRQALMSRSWMARRSDVGSSAPRPVVEIPSRSPSASETNGSSTRRNGAPVSFPVASTSAPSSSLRRSASSSSPGPATQDTNTDSRLPQHHTSQLPRRSMSNKAKGKQKARNISSTKSPSTTQTNIIGTQHQPIDLDSD